MYKINNSWYFTEEYSEEFRRGEVQGTPVRIPHTVRELPLHYADHNSYQMVSGYRRKLKFDPADKEKRHFIQFDGAAHIATVWFNGTLLGTHSCGYTAFRYELTDLIDWEGDNCVCVKLDSTENPSIPPFGFVIDYLTYGGIYRDVSIDVRPRRYIHDMFVTTPDLTCVNVALRYKGDASDEPVLIEIIDENRNIIASKTVTQKDRKTEIAVKNVLPWTHYSPTLYTCRVSLGEDVKETQFGFRRVTWKENDLMINGEPVFLRGLNRHQCFPYAGYAVPDALQAEDARILKEELGVNAVRTSHYPQSHAFIDACDKLGLYVFTEIPGWQHLGDREWKKQAILNTREMVLQYRNHPSIILWGCRINESMDDDELYHATTETARRLDPTRPTSGVRYIEKSNLLEDIYGYNDFSHTGANAGVKKKKDVMKDTGSPLLITEANGHMFPTKSFDPWQKRQEHALRHARVLNDAREDGDHCGCFQWCMFDYPTHKDFGSGDRICYHGVMDSFRNPKLAAAVYASQQDKTPVLEIGSTMDIGDYPGGSIPEIYAFTNADEVRLYKNSQYVTTFTKTKFRSLTHGPVEIDDTIGCLLQTNEGFTGRKEKMIREALTAAGKYGISSLPAKNLAQLGWCMVRYGMKYEEGVELYGKYVGSWGGDATVWTFEGWKYGKCVSRVTRSPGVRLHLDTKVSHSMLQEGDTYDMASVRIRILDEHDNIASYAQLPVSFTAEGPIEIVGPETTAAEGGMCGTYIRTTGQPGTARLTIRADGMEDAVIRFDIQGEIK